MKMKKFALLAAACAILVSGCAKNAGSAEFAPKQSSIYLTREGKVTSAMVENLENEYYDEAEFLASAESDLEAFNTAAKEQTDGANSEPAAVLRECSLKDNTARLLWDFKNPEEYIRFAEMFLYDGEDNKLTALDVTTVSDGLVKGYIAGSSFKRAAGDGKAVSADEVTKQSKLYVAAVTGAALIQTDGKIEFVSDNVTVNGAAVQTPAEGVSYIVFK